MKPEKDNSKAVEKNEQKKQKPAIEDLTTPKVSDTDATRVKGGFNPQPEPPGRHRST